MEGLDRVYLVLGSSGDYSDFREWPVRAFASKQEADACVRVCYEAAEARPVYPEFPAGFDWRTATHAQLTAHRLDVEAWTERVRAHAAACPDDHMPDRDSVDYNVAEVPFGAASTAHATAPIRLRHTARRWDLTEDENKR